MPAPRLPAAKAEAAGSAIKNPQRFRDRSAPKSIRPLGQPYAKMTEPQCEAWEEFRAELPWLNSSHRALLQVACVLRARLNNDPDIGINALQTYSAILSKLGATPVDETKVNHGDEGEDDPSDKFFGRPN